MRWNKIRDHIATRSTLWLWWQSFFYLKIEICRLELSSAWAYTEKISTRCLYAIHLHICVPKLIFFCLCISVSHIFPYFSRIFFIENMANECFCWFRHFLVKRIAYPEYKIFPIRKLVWQRICQFWRACIRFYIECTQACTMRRHLQAICQSRHDLCLYLFHDRMDHKFHRYYWFVFGIMAYLHLLAKCHWHDQHQPINHTTTRRRNSPFELECSV